MDVKLGIIGGTGLENGLDLGGSTEKHVKSEYTCHGQKNCRGYDATSYYDGRVFYVNRHAVSMYSNLSAAYPDEIDYRRLIAGLCGEGVTHVVSTSAVGVFDPSRYMKPGALAVPNNLIDYLNPDCSVDIPGKSREYADFSEPFDFELRDGLLVAGRRNGVVLADSGLYVRRRCGRIFETSAEVEETAKMNQGKLLYFGMTVPQEAAVARLLGIKYATVVAATNLAAGVGAEITHDDNKEVFQMSISDIIF